MINGVGCIQNQFTGKMNGYSIYYQLAVFETEEQFLQLLTWCYESEKEQHQSEMDRMIYSFEVN